MGKNLTSVSGPHCRLTSKSPGKDLPLRAVIQLDDMALRMRRNLHRLSCLDGSSKQGVRIGSVPPVRPTCRLQISALPLKSPAQGRADPWNERLRRRVIGSGRDPNAQSKPEELSP